MRKQTFLLIMMVLILAATVVLRLTSKSKLEPTLAQDSIPNPLLVAPATTGVVTSAPAMIEPTSVSDTPVAMINQPSANSVIKSPLTITGQARGFWFFEANLPIKLVTADGQVVATTGAQAKSNWMTGDLVPFAATLNFTAPATSSQGYLVIAKDNPSGLPEHDASITIPVLFK